MRFRGGLKTTNGGTDGALPACALVAGASTSLLLRKVEIQNTTTTACVFALRRLTTAGTPGTGQSEIPDDPDAAAANGDVKDSYSATAPTLTAGYIEVAQLGAAVGSGWTWVWEDGLRIPEGTANGIGLVPVGTGQIIVAHFTWDE